MKAEEAVRDIKFIANEIAYMTVADELAIEYIRSRLDQMSSILEEYDDSSKLLRE